ncbi:MAG TPA: hypothetical protein VFM65_07430 [Flavobacteriaceae bacterium]|nr:hypothetical protein [Flavobacteriaceae bacterium]
MKKIFLLSFLISFAINGQEIVTNDSLQITFKRSKEAAKFFNANQSNKVKGDELKKILIRCKIKSLNDKPVDINAFSLIDTKNKVRYRIADYMGYKGFSIGIPPESNKLLKTQLLNKRGKPWPDVPKYDPSVPDSFEAYNFDGYQNIEIPTNFSINKNKPKISVVYYGPTTLRRFTSDMFFVILNELQNPKLEFYYKHEKIADIEID